MDDNVRNELVTLAVELVGITLRSMIRVAEVAGLSPTACDEMFRETMDAFTKRDPSKLPRL